MLIKIAMFPLSLNVLLPVSVKAFLLVAITLIATIVEGIAAGGLGDV
jgi:hypothetical protein